MSECLKILRSSPERHDSGYKSKHLKYTPLVSNQIIDLEKQAREGNRVMHCNTGY